MQYTSNYSSPLGNILLSADDEGLTGLWFFGQQRFASTLGVARGERETAAIQKAKAWLDEYFAGRAPGAFVPLHLTGTAFQLAVWRTLCLIPYGKTVSYGEIARRVEELRGGGIVSARAVGGAVGRNPVSIIVPCHRVVGANGRLTGYAGGIERKAALLKLEGAAILALSDRRAAGRRDGALDTGA